MRKLFTGLVLLLAVQLHAQSGRMTGFFDLGLILSATNYSGDLAEPHLEMAQTRFGGAVYARYQWHPLFSVRGQIFAGKIAGDDKHSPVHAGRNFRFSTSIIEATGMFELSIGNFQYDPLQGRESRYISPYIFAGAGAAFVQPDVTFYGPPAERDKFVRNAIPEGGNAWQTLLVTPVGLGVRVNSGAYWSVGIEASARPTYSDLLDGVSQNGNPGEDDWYYTIGIYFSYYLNGPWRLPG